MDFTLSDEHRMFQRAIRDFAEKEIDPQVEEAEEKEEFPVELFPKMGKLGYLGIRYPEKYGGPLLVPAIKGEKIAALGLTEPNAGSDISSIQTTARKDGDSYIVNGSKIFITNGTIADFVLVAAYTDKSRGTKGISLLVLERGTPGFTIARKLKKLGNRSSDTGELVFEDCRIPKENLIGEENRGFGYIVGALKSGRIIYGARSVGVAQAAFEAALQYAKERVQFGQPIGKFQANQFKLAKMATAIEAARTFTFRAAWMLDQGIECMKEASMVKLFATEMVQWVTAEAVQLHGGYGYMMEYPVQRYFRDAKMFTITEGTSEIQQVVIARELGL
uniref:Acyl-CoA dehydrogenase n=1 Tax=uncultured bacterium Rifle_16ft_4_minimus_4226 TaxID=1665160 RepID=A0A0H4TBD9_9BACT|nr:acyl-CoA dehydrogenase [uncultured bacterium Rifle_16ft_4_minimus_4226]